MHPAPPPLRPATPPPTPSGRGRHTMADAIRAVPTWYKGTRYRSTLEADWASTLDWLGLYAEYEPEAVELPGGEWYLPDFYLPKQRIYCEVKGPTNQRIHKSIDLQAARGDHLVVILRPAGPGGAANWELADDVALQIGFEQEPTLTHRANINRCSRCSGWSFNRIVWDTAAPPEHPARYITWVCRLCGGELCPEVTYIPAWYATRLDSNHGDGWVDLWYGGYGRLPFQRVPRRRVAT